ncbi:ce529d9d-79b8-4ec7-bf6d-5b2dd05072ad [Thermothielavioides terrestris]|uniref:Ce529d9d-79b8-4ec7-bf6d-5b2dd05072ad n=1 Tax=Thermothielavioides terrestris TaxID=2587410 RepID=A0A446B6T4_9PEZI|nr:ce529d9d-79b8-4ec7-bf6d-5b2dd05072ad [Thermothielavioides terrestris]
MPPTQPKVTLLDTPTPPPHLLARLQSHLPYSLPVLRRLQFARNFPGGSTRHTHILYAAPRTACGEEEEAEAEEEELSTQRVDGNSSVSRDATGKRAGQAQAQAREAPFAAAYVDLSRGPETQVWLYCSALEDGDDGSGGSSGRQRGLAVETEEQGEGIELVLALLRRVRGIALADADADADADAEAKAPGHGNNGVVSKGEVEEMGGEEGTGRRGTMTKVLVGSLHETVRQGLLARGVAMEKSPSIPAELEWEYCGKWLFRVEDLPAASAEVLPQGMRWDRVRKEDVALVLERTSIKRRELKDGTPVAWAFMGLDGTIITLHVEEAYRRMGLAKALGCRLMREYLHEYGNDGWGAADVFVENSGSQAFCRSIGGKLSWTLSW